MTSSWLWLSFVFSVTVSVISASNCFNPDTANTCSGSGRCAGTTCECFPGYEGQWCQTCKNCDQKCGEIRPCAECNLFNTGPAKYTDTCGECGYLSALNVEDIKQNQYDPRKSKTMLKNGTCQIVDDSGCDLTFWYGYDVEYRANDRDDDDYYYEDDEEDDGSLVVWTSKIDRVCPPSEDKEVAEKCSKKTTCMDCERSPGCGWCSSPQMEIKSRCNSIKENEMFCPSERREEKLNSVPTIIKESREQKSRWSKAQLHPQQVELEMNVGDVQYLNFTYMFINSGTSLSHDLPENVDLKIFSSCGGDYLLTEVSGCYGIFNGNSVKFYARFHLKSCPEKFSDWEKSYKLTLSQGDVLDIDLKMFCSCSCDKFSTDGICRNDKKTFMDINPCAGKNSCSECLRDSACNWCSDSKFSYFDGSPLPRCNNDSFFTSGLCNTNGKVDPPKALIGSEDCSTCNHTCSGGICSENKQDLLDLNMCVSHLTCGDCIMEAGCAWCPQTDGAPMCNLVSNWIVENEERKDPNMFECQEHLYVDQSKISTDKIEFLQNSDYIYEDSPMPEMADNAVEITIQEGQSFNLELLLKINLDHRNFKENQKYDEVKLMMKSKDEKSLSYVKLKYDYICKGRKCTKYDTVSNLDELSFNASIELSECPERSINEPIYVLACNEYGESYPYGLVEVNVEAFCKCECEDKCSLGYEKQHSSCGGGNRKCGICQDCPDGSFGEFCECATEGSDKKTSELKGLPSVLIGKKDGLAGKPGKNFFEDKISFSHTIVPLDVSPDTLKCNATYCMNTNSRECYTLDENNSKFDIARAANLFAIYGDHHLLPGAEIIFRYKYCPLKLSYWGTHETRFGFGTPPSKNTDYTLPQKQSSDMQNFWSDDSLTWGTKGIDRDHAYLQDVSYTHAATFEETDWRGNKEQVFLRKTPEGQGGYLGYVKQEIDSDIKLVVTETEVIWSWEGFYANKRPNLTELRQTIDMKEKKYYPLFLLPGCEDDGDFSAVEIISSKVGKA